MQFFKSTLVVSLAFAATFVAAAPHLEERQCLGLIAHCTENVQCCTNKCIASVSVSRSLHCCQSCILIGPLVIFSSAFEIFNAIEFCADGDRVSSSGEPHYIASCFSLVDVFPSVNSGDKKRLIIVTHIYCYWTNTYCSAQSSFLGCD